MSEQSLREALEKLVERYRGWTSHRAIADKLESLLAAHPVESLPRPVIDRQAALKAIVAASEPDGSDCILGREYVENYADVFVDAVMELARSEAEVKAEALDAAVSEIEARRLKGADLTEQERGYNDGIEASADLLREFIDEHASGSES